MQGLVILGATGTIGRNTLDIVRRHPERIRVLALSANRDVEAMVGLCREFRPRIAAMADFAAAEQLKNRLRELDLSVEVLGGPDAATTVAALPDADQVMSAIVGAVGLLPTLAAVRAGKRVLIANKEPLVMAGALVLEEAQRAGALLLPIDSEHNAIFQCLPAGSQCGTPPRGVRRLTLTASGGPFRQTPLDQLSSVTPAQAVRHPNWVMGQKISVDSATMMNKGLELIEAAVLYGVSSSQIDVVIHPQSAIHSIVEYVDGSMLAQIGQSDMRVPIAHALAWPERWTSGVDPLDLPALGRFDFEAPDLRRFPCLVLARAALESGGIAPLALNAANEIAVQAFLDGQLPYLGIAELIEHTMSKVHGEALGQGRALDEILHADARVRAIAQETLHA
ncbi:1-deoxy-D-xylulose-5-phosphate reductoisomerase [Sinimarinibacterium sp. CAU 1509]|uniref:1-deoxy-D-xylulose-5-phosphate reductoisomerase n=1 Tax=Sinimarinibacterium sp. CAU 1509 TaxID=2562283 RepID=UPI0010AC4FB5|nr:1-deoxy-D-xylulose-5-phosphate reductoisomerase [Sinimarinibacterium sp. CAU 1509]TJY62087.1 1-deoxy-D-xylulose-5-phosphate reductoisomerase [Sinimarinibacterium sp. CAU 1509]